MMKKAYLSTLSDQWLIERQRELLGTREREYVDEIKAAALARLRDPDTKPAQRDKDLKMRASMLARSSRTDPEVCEVASFLCLAVNTADLLDVVARASARGISLVALDTGRQITAGPGAEELAREIPFFQAALRRRGLQTRTEHAAKLEENARQRARAVEHLYRLSDDEMPLDAVRQAAADSHGRPMAPATLVKHLGKRKDAQRLYAAGLKRSATAAAKREQREEPDA